MKKSKIFIGLGSLVLAVGAFFTTKANKMFYVTTGAFVNSSVTPGANNATVASLPSNHWTFTSTNNKTVILVTAGVNKTKLGTLVTSVAGQSILYYKP